MEILCPSCAGLDVHKKTVVACAITSGGRELRTFGALTEELLALSAWLAEQGVTDVAMESTGSFWKPIYNLLEGRFGLIVANARHIKAVPGRKSAWNGRLLRQQDRGHPRAVEGATGSLKGAGRVQRASCR